MPRLGRFLRRGEACLARATNASPYSRWIADIASSGQTRIAVRMLVSRIERIMLSSNAAPMKPE